MIEALIQQLLQAVLEPLMQRGWISAGGHRARITQCPRCASIKIKRAVAPWFWPVMFLPVVVGVTVFTVLLIAGVACIVGGFANLVGLLHTIDSGAVVYILGGVVLVVAALAIFAGWAVYITSKDPVGCSGCGYQWPRADATAPPPDKVAAHG